MCFERTNEYSLNPDWSKMAAEYKLENVDLKPQRYAETWNFVALAV